MDLKNPIQNSMGFFIDLNTEHIHNSFSKALEAINSFPQIHHDHQVLPDKQDVQAHHSQRD